MKQSLYQIDFEELTQRVQAMGEARYRAKQIWEFLYNKRIANIDAIYNLPNRLIEKLKKQYVLFDMSIALRQVSADGCTRKYLITLKDNHQIECVLMKYAHGFTLCISTQVGCAMGCSFCASTVDGLVRHLEAYEMWEQVLLVNQSENIRISNIVLMGSGEPLHNYNQVLTFIKTISQSNHLGIGQRHITLSTCGLVDNIKRLANEKLQITLAVSLHTPFDEQRNQIVPVNRQYGIKALMMAIDGYIEKTHRRISIEYALISGQNDTLCYAKALIKLFKDKLVHINLIPINPIEERDYQPSCSSDVQRFKKIIEAAHLNVTIRRELGDDIDAACGQLRQKSIKNKEEIVSLCQNK